MAHSSIGSGGCQAFILLHLLQYFGSVVALWTMDDFADKICNTYLGVEERNNVNLTKFTRLFNKEKRTKIKKVIVGLENE